jgi:hypothetical protein
MKVHENGFIEITNAKDAKEALQSAKNLQDEIAEVKAESGLDELEKDLTAYKAALRDFMVRSDIEHVEGDGFHGTLVKGSGGSRWITDEDDRADLDPARCRPLKSIIMEKFGVNTLKGKHPKVQEARKLFNRITKRVADPEAIEEAVNEKLLDVDEISPAWVEIQRAPYLRIFED